jgi:hypothetical protein
MEEYSPIEILYYKSENRLILSINNETASHYNGTRSVVDILGLSVNNRGVKNLCDLARIWNGKK